MLVDPDSITRLPSLCGSVEVANSITFVIYRHKGALWIRLSTHLWPRKAKLWPICLSANTTAVSCPLHSMGFAYLLNVFLHAIFASTAVYLVGRPREKLP